MSYQVKFQRIGVQVVRAGLFGTIQEAKAFAATIQPKFLTATVSIVEIDDNGDEIGTNEFAES